MTGMSRLLALVLVSICALVLAACGGDSDETLTAAEFKKQGNAACAAYEKDVKGFEAPTTLEQVGEFAGKTRTRFVELLDDLNALKPPSELAKQHEELIALGTKSSAALQELSKAGEAADQAKLQTALASAAATDKEGDAVANKLGLTDCTDGQPAG